MRIWMGVFVAAAGAFAQGPPPHGRGPFGPGPAARVLGAEAGMPGRVVKGAPYSADVVTETTQTLADGNHIRQTATSRVYRDTEGRTRTEQSLSGLGALAPHSNLPPVVFINDPVAHVNYALNPAGKTATKSGWMRARGGGPGYRPKQDSNASVKTESIGRQAIEGLPADGTRITTVIPAGQVGNEQPIQAVTERWYSPDLQTFVLTKVSDPRFGETVTRVSNISRAEPAHSLFEVPADYKMNEAPERGRGAKQ
jgi:hypothetical protein